MTTRTTVRAALAAPLLALLVAAVPAPPPAAAAATADLAVRPIVTTATVPASDLGPDAVVAVVDSSVAEALEGGRMHRSLEVVTGDGARHPVYSVSTRRVPGGWYPGDFVLADWRPELHTALLRVSRGSHGDTLLSYDVTTGTVHEVEAPERASTVALAPDGSGVLMTTYMSNRGAGRVATLGWDGTRLWLPARADGRAITSIDGRTVVTVDDQRWWVVDLATRSSTTLELPSWCVPHRWLDADTVVASCGRAGWSQLRAVSLDGSSVRLGLRHTAKTRRSGPAVFDDADVRTVQGRSFYESHGGCGGGFLTRQTDDGRVRPVPVPWRDGALTLVGARGDDLVVAHHPDDCDARRARSVLALLDPVTGQVVELTRLAGGESWREVVQASEVQAWIGW